MKWLSDWLLEWLWDRWDSKHKPAPLEDHIPTIWSSAALMYPLGDVIRFEPRSNIRIERYTHDVDSR